MFNGHPEISYVRVLPRWRHLVHYGEHGSSYEDIFFANPNVLDIFSFPLLQVQAENALDTPRSVLITRSKARQYFGSEDVLGETLSFMDEPYTITGVLENLPRNFHFRFDLLTSLHNFKAA